MQLQPGFTRWIEPVGPKAAEMLANPAGSFFHPSGPSEFGYLI